MRLGDSLGGWVGKGGAGGELPVTLRLRRGRKTSEGPVTTRESLATEE